MFKINCMLSNLAILIKSRFITILRKYYIYKQSKEEKQLLSHIFAEEQLVEDEILEFNCDLDERYPVELNEADLLD